MAVGHRSILCKRLTCQPKLAHERSLCPFIGGTQVRFWGELLFFLSFFPLLSLSFFSSLLFSLFCTSFFPPPFLSSSNFFLPFSPAFLPSFFLLQHSFPIPFFLFYFLFPFLLPLSAAFLSLFSPFILFS